ncbi:hypothetical protein D3C71_2149450 [compost metagenome]
MSVLLQNPDHIREIILILRIVVGHPAQCRKQLLVVEAVRAGVDLLHQSLLRRTILLLHDAHNLAVTAADHPAVSGGV